MKQQQPKIIRKYDPNTIDVAVSLNVRKQPGNEIKLIQRNTITDMNNNDWYQKEATEGKLSPAAGRNYTLSVPKFKSQKLRKILSKHNTDQERSVLDLLRDNKKEKRQKNFLERPVALKKEKPV